MLTRLRDGLILLLAIQLTLTPLMAAHAEMEFTETPATDQVLEHVEANPQAANAQVIKRLARSKDRQRQAQQSDSYENSPVMSLIAYEFERCADDSGYTHHCKVCVCIHGGVFHAGIPITKMPNHVTVTSIIRYTPYHIDLDPPFRPPISPA